MVKQMMQALQTLIGSELWNNLFHCISLSNHEKCSFMISNKLLSIINFFCMKKNLLLATMFMLSGFSNCFPQSAKQAAVEKQTEQLKKAMVDADSSMLDKLTAAELSYGHSSGHIDTKAEFISKILSGKSDFVSIELSEQTISISGNTAVVRHKLNAVTNDNGKAGEVHLYVLLIWHKQHGGWKLIARQAVKQQ